MAKGNNRAPQLTAILIGEDPASQTYVRNKMKVSELSYRFSRISHYKSYVRHLRPQLM
jgi:5,10-methylene-tetrahydrofolate dehydrogenase/methenyl tetrahydrofolate cyclohydrolase